jgi:hypothetical protein
LRFAEAPDEPKGEKRNAIVTRRLHCTSPEAFSAPNCESPQFGVCAVFPNKFFVSTTSKKETRPFTARVNT